MANIFRKKDSYIDRVNRSTFDLSFVNNLTMKFGVHTPVCCLPVGFGDSFQINARFNLQLLPTVFPIQTQLYVRLHFVYVRTRTLWSDWMSFFGGDESVVPPFLGLGTEAAVKSMASTGSLGDYLGLPTTLIGAYGHGIKVNISSLSTVYLHWNYPTNGYNVLKSALSTVTIDELLPSSSGSINDDTAAVFIPLGTIPSATFKELGSEISFSGSIKLPFMPSDSQNDNILRTCPFVWVGNVNTVCGRVYAFDNSMELTTIYDADADTTTYTFGFTLSDVISDPEDAEPVGVYFGFMRPFVSTSGERLPFDNIFLDASGAATGSVSFGTSTVRDIDLDTSPYARNAVDQDGRIRISALPFRAYEAYYNAFGRDVRNNPFMINGKPEYNKYVPSTDGGVDNYSYGLHYANWEPDAYTTALQSPQAGIAPLVGITSLGEATFRDAAGTEYHAQLETAEDGDTVTGFQVTSSNAPADVIRNLVGMATSGISISDFRNVNSLQRFLEIRIRQSPRYKNLAKGLFDVNLDYDELMMPEFLGGISDTIPVYKVTQTTPTEDTPLGSFAGQGSLQSGMRHVIRKYCPEEGYILGIMSVVPAANYSQLLAPHFTRMQLLDWHFPQFNNISYQPMLYKHLCPVQAFNNDPKALNNVFGYQRAYWDLISSFDEVHGQFRTSLRNFLINRVFDVAPQLSQDFLLVNPDTVNDVFAVTSESGDKILGSIAFDITKKTTIPRNSIPHIE